MAVRLSARRSIIASVAALALIPGTIAIGSLAAHANPMSVTVTVTGLSGSASGTVLYAAEFRQNAGPTITPGTLTGSDGSSATFSVLVEPTDPNKLMFYASNVASGQVGSGSAGQISSDALTIAVAAAGITGTVVDNKKGNPVAGASVNFNSMSGGFFTVTDTSGQFATSGSFESGSIFIQPPQESGLNPQEFQEAPTNNTYVLYEGGGGGGGGGQQCDPSAEGAVTGTVTDGTDPVSNALVLAAMINPQGTDAWDIRQGNSSDDGTFCIDTAGGGGNGTWTVYASGDAGGTKVSTPTAAGKDLELVLDNTPAVSGIAEDANGDPLQYSRVTLRDGEGMLAAVTNTDDSGNFALGVGSFTGEQLLEINAPWGSDPADGVTTKFDLPHSGAFQLVAPNFFGTVYDSDGTTPLAFANVGVSTGRQWLGNAQTTGSGQFGMYVDTSQCTSITVNISGGRRGDQQESPPAEGAPISEEVACADIGSGPIDFTLAEANYRGTVVDVDGETPVSNAMVRLQGLMDGHPMGPSQQTQTDESGGFALNVPFGDGMTYAVIIGTPWDQSLTEQGGGTTYIGVIDEQPADPVVLALKEPNIRMMVKLANGRAAKNTNVNFTGLVGSDPKGDYLGSVQTGSQDGSAYMWVPDSYFEDGVSAQVNPPDNDNSGSTVTTFKILAPMAEPANFQLEGANARVLVLGPDLEPMRWSWVNVNVPNRPEWYGAQTDENGYALFSIRGLDLDKEYQVQAQVPWNYPDELAPVSKTARFEIDGENESALPTITVRFSVPNFRAYIKTPSGQAMPWTGIELRKKGSWNNTWMNSDDRGVVFATLEIPESGTDEYYMTVRPWGTVNGQVLADKTYTVLVDDTGDITVVGRTADADGYFTLTPAAPNLLVKVVGPDGSPQRWSWVDMFNTSTKQGGSGSSTQSDGTTGFAIDTGSKQQTFAITARAPWGQADLSDSATCEFTFLGDTMVDTSCDMEGGYLLLTLRSPNATITVTDGTDPVPYAGVCASTLDWSSWTCAGTNEDGQAVMNLPEDDYQLEVQPPWGETEFASARTTIDASEFVEGRLDKTVALGAPNFSVTVLAGVSTARWAYVSLIRKTDSEWEWVSGGPTGESGVARLGVTIDGVDDGDPLGDDYCLDVWPGEAAADGYAHYFDCGGLVLGENTVTLRSANVQSMVTDSSGSANVWGFAWFEGDTPGTSTWANIDESGELKVYLPDGDYTATIYPGPGSTGIPKRIAFSVASGEPDGSWPNEIQLSEGKLNGTVTDAGGNPVTAGFVFADPQGGGDGTYTPIRKDGSFALAMPDGSDLASGTWDVSVVVPDGFGSFSTIQIEVDTDGTLKSGSLALVCPS